MDAPEQQYKIMVARPCSLHIEHPDIATWLTLTGFRWRNDPRLAGVELFVSDRHRVHEARNDAVLKARASGCTHLLFVDPDMQPDMYVPGFNLHKNNPTKDWALPFWESSFQHILKYGGVIAAPACAGPPDYKVNVYVYDGQEIRRVTRPEAAKRKESIEQVVAIGTGLMLIDMKIFDVLPPPWFADEYRDHHEANIHCTQDCHFCLLCGRHGIPVWANWYSWAGHWKLLLVGQPEEEESEEPVDTDVFSEALECEEALCP